MVVKKKPSVVVIGGGTGTYTVLTALKDKQVDLTALMTMVDDGGSNRVLRDEFGLLPTSGIRQAMVALSNQQSLVQKLFSYRFHQGNGITGMTFGNLFMAAVADMFGSQKRAIEETSKFLGIRGTILPISYDDVRLVARYENGLEITGEHLIDEPKHDGTLHITKLYTQPVATISKESKAAIFKADLIILGPGDFYTNTIANLVIKGVVPALLKTKATIVFCVNLMTKYGEAYNYTANDYINDLNQYLPSSRLNYILINNDSVFPKEVLEMYEQEKSAPVIDDLKQVNVIRIPLLSKKIIKAQKGDILKRSIIRHDTTLLGTAIMKILRNY